MVPQQLSTSEDRSQQVVNGDALFVKFSRPRSDSESPKKSNMASVSEKAMSYLPRCERALVKSILCHPEEMRRHSAGLLIQCVFRGKQAKNRVRAMERDLENQGLERGESQKLSIYAIAKAQQTSAHVAINAEVNVQRRNMSTTEKAHGYFDKIDDLRIPAEYRAQNNVLGLVLPCFIPRLEYHYQIAEMQRLSGYRHSTLCLAALILLLTFSALFRDLSDLDTDTGSIPNWFIFICVLSGLSLIWLGIFFQVGRLKRFGNRKGFLLKNVAVVTVTVFVLWQSFDGHSSTSETGQSIAKTDLVRIFLGLMCWAALPQPKYLPPMLVICTCAPVTWLVGCTLRGDADTSLIEHACYYLVFGVMLYVVCRKSDLDSRRSYLLSRQSQNTIMRKEKEINAFKQSVMKSGTLGKDGGFFKNMFDQERKKISTLKDTLDNYQAKDEMQKLHEQLISDYVRLGASDGTDAELMISSIEERFAKLQNLAAKESDRLASILKDLYLVFEELPEWEPVLKLPAFSKVQIDSSDPLEKVHQTSHCNWWSKQDLYPPTLNRVGIAKEPLQWFGCRAQWAKTPYVDVLRKAVSEFNQASSVHDLNLSPSQVMRLWNDLNPDKKMKDMPFPEGLSLDSNFKVTMDHDYIEVGRHAGLQVGPAKDRLRILAKVAAYRENRSACPATECVEKYITDWLRARVVFVNPSALAVFFWYLMFCVPTLKIIRCKNKLTRDPFMKKANSSNLAWCIHLNVQFDVQGEQHLAELQLVLESFCIARDLGHKYYEFTRAESLADLLAPVLERVPPSILGTSKDAMVSSTSRDPSNEGNQFVKVQVHPGPDQKKIQVHPAPDQTILVTGVVPEAVAPTVCKA